MMSEDIDFILNKCPIGLIVFDRKLNMVFQNKRAMIFLNRLKLPPEITTINLRIFDAIAKNKLSEQFPGEIYLTKRVEGSLSNWIFRFYIYEKANPLVYLLIIEDTISSKLDINEIRQQYRLTRRETDILRRAVNGLKNIEIAEDLEISEQTVKDHLSNIYMKTNAENRLALMRTLLHNYNTQS